MSDNFRELLDDIVNHPDKLEDLSLEELVQIQKQMDPLGHTVSSGDKKYANISIINFRDEYLKRMLGTSMIGFIYRQLYEYEPLKDADIADALAADRKDLLSIYHKDGADDTSTSVVSAGKAEVDPPVDASVVPTDAPSPFVQDTGLTREETIAKNVEIKSHIKTFLDSIFEFDPDRHARGAFDKVDKTKENWASELRLRMQTTLGEETKAAAIIEPSADLFHNWGRYRDNHYEEFVEAVGVLYLDTPDLEFAINFYDAFEELEDSETHIKAQQDNVIAPIITIENGAWTYLSARKENRDKISYDNKDTELLRRMTQKIKEDQSLGKDMMQKRVKYEKKKNVLREGPDDKALDRYKSAVTTIATLGAKEGLSKDEREKLSAAYYAKEMEEVPENAIQVDVWGPDKDGNVNRSKFYTEAEAPEYLKEAQQNNRSDNRSDNRVITARDGSKKTIGDIKKAQ